MPLGATGRAWGNGEGGKLLAFVKPLPDVTATRFGVLVPIFRETTPVLSAPEDECSDLSVAFAKSAENEATLVSAGAVFSERISAFVALAPISGMSTATLFSCSYTKCARCEPNIPD